MGPLGSLPALGWEEGGLLEEDLIFLARESLGHDVDLQQTGHCMHSVEDPKGQANVHNSRPHGIAIEVQFCIVVEVGPGTKRWHDPELFEEMGE